MKKVLVLLTAGVLLVGSIFAFGPAKNVAPGYRYAPQSAQTQPVQQAQQTQTTLQTRQQLHTTTRLYQNLPANATLSEVKTFKGTIKDVSWSAENGFQLQVQVGNSVYTVHAGPLFRALTLKSGQEIEITGRIVTADNVSYIVAESVTTGGKTVKVDDVIPGRQNSAAKTKAPRSPQRGPRV